MGWKYVLNQSSFEFYTSQTRRGRNDLMQGLELIAGNPETPFGWRGRDDAGREIHLRVFRSFTYSYWLDPWSEEIRITRIEKTR